MNKRWKNEHKGEDAIDGKKRKRGKNEEKERSEHREKQKMKVVH